jgi:hypothetical protein
MTTKILDFQIEAVGGLLERAANIRHGSRPTGEAKARIAQAAESLSKAGALRGQLDLCIEAMAALVGILYHADDDGQPCNFDRATCRLLVPAPWGAAGWRAWGVRKWEAQILRSILIERSQQRRRLPVLFDYNAEARTWHLNLQEYPSAEAALGWLRKDAPSLAEWRTAVVAYRESDSERRRKL